MAGTGYQSSDSLTLFNVLAGRQPTGDSITDAQKYQQLAWGQDIVVAAMANIAGFSLYSAPTLMTSADGGYTYTFGVDGNGYPLFPLAAQIFPNLTAVPDYPWVPGIDYLDEGTLIRLPNHTTYAGPLYYRGISTPQQMTSGVQPVIQPPQFRSLIAIRAVWNFAESAVRNDALAALMERRWNRDWPIFATAMRKHLRGPRTLGPLTGGPMMGGSGGMPMGGLGW